MVPIEKSLFSDFSHSLLSVRNDAASNYIVLSFLRTQEFIKQEDGCHIVLRLPARPVGSGHDNSFDSCNSCPICHFEMRRMVPIEKSLFSNFSHSLHSVRNDSCTKSKRMLFCHSRQRIRLWIPHRTSTSCPSGRRALRELI